MDIKIWLLGICNFVQGAHILRGFVCAYHSAAPVSSPIYAYLTLYLNSVTWKRRKQTKKKPGFVQFFCKNCFLLAREIWRTLVWKPNFDLIKAKSKLSVAFEGVLVPISIFQYPAKFNSYLIQIFPSAKVKSWKTIEKTFYFNRFQTKNTLQEKNISKK